MIKAGILENLKNQENLPPVVLTIAGSDSSAGAGIQADIKAIHAAGCYALTALTAVVAEVPGHVRTIHNLPASLVEDQIRVCFEFYPIAAVKTGMLPTYEIIHTVSKLLNSFRSSGCVFYLIVDPVMVASAGDKLISDDAIEAYRTALLPIADLVTPNLDEASVFLNCKITNITELQSAAVQLASTYKAAFLCKGGHLRSEKAIDVLVEKTKMWLFESPFVPQIETHGSGCTFSSAIAARLALGHDLASAIAGAKSYLYTAILNCHHWPQVSSLAHLNLPAASKVAPPEPTSV